MSIASTTTGLTLVLVDGLSDGAVAAPAMPGYVALIFGPLLAPAAGLRLRR